MMTLAFVFAAPDATDTGGASAERYADAPAHGERARTDAALAARIRDGDHAAFTTIFLTHYDGLCRFAKGYTRDASDAEELVEGVLARVWERRREFDPPGGVGPYLYAAVRNRVLNAARDARTRLEWQAAHAADGAEQTAPGMGTAPASMLAQLEREELGAVLRRVIETLPEHRRAVVTMRWFGGLSHAEIAAALGTSVNAVEIQLRRALKDLAAGVPDYLRE